MTMLDNVAMVSTMTTDHIPDNPRSADELNREVRTLKWKLKTLGKQNGRQGTTIYGLRNEVVALRVGLSVFPGDYKRVLQRLREAEEENRRLREKLDVQGRRMAEKGADA